MGRNNKKGVRANKVAQEVFEAEIERKKETIPEIVKDEALFKLDGEEKKEKKGKIVLHPRIPQPEPKKPEVKPFYDLWGNDAPAKKPQSKKVQKQKPGFAPTSAEAYNTNVLLKQKKEEEPSEVPAPPDPSISTIQTDDGIADTLVDEVDIRPADPTIAPPPVPEKPEKPVQFPPPIKRYYDEETKQRLRQEHKEANIKLLEIQNKPFVEENENLTPEAVAQLQAQIEAEKTKEHKPKADKKAEMFITDEPELAVDEQASKLTELEPDTKGFARLQRSLELRRKVGLHE